MSHRLYSISDDQMRLFKKALEVASERDALTNEEQHEAGLLCTMIDAVLADPAVEGREEEINGF